MPRPSASGLPPIWRLLRALPAVPLEPCEKRAAGSRRRRWCAIASNDYSVPTAYGFRDVLVKGFVDEVVILCAGEEIARHRRCYGAGVFVFDPLHYLALIETKPNALDQAAPLQGWDLPEAFQHLRHLLEARMGNRGKREFIQVLRLLEAIPMEIVAAAVTEAIRLGAIGFDAVKQIALARIERRPARLDLTAYPHLPKTAVRTTSAADYAVLGGMTGRQRRDAGGNDERHAAGAARPSPQAAEAADGPAGVRQGRPRMRPRRRRSSPLSAAPGRAGTDRPRAPHGRAADPGGQVPGGEEPRHVRLHRHPQPQQDAGARAGPLRVHPAPGERHRARQLRHRQDPCRARARPCRLPEGLHRRLHHRRRPGASADGGPRRAPPAEAAARTRRR